MDLTALTPLDGGWSGETFVAEVAGERSVVRIYAGASHRGANAHEVDAALLRLVRGLVPVPEVLEIRRADPAAGPPPCWSRRSCPGCAATCCSRTSTSAAWPCSERDWAGSSPTWPGCRCCGPGRSSTATSPSAPSPLEGQSIDGLPGVRGAPRGGASLHWSPAELEGLREVAVDAQALLDTVGRFCLVHSDVNPKNLLVDPDTLRRHRAARLGVRPRRAPLHRPRQPAALRPAARLRRGGARRLRRPARRLRPSERSTWPAPPTCGRWSTWPPGGAEPGRRPGPRPPARHRPARDTCADSG